MRTIFLSALLGGLLVPPASAQTPAPGVDIPGDGDVPLDERLAREPLDRSLLTAQGFDYHSARAVALAEAEQFAEAEQLFRKIVEAELAAPDRYDPYLAWAETGLARTIWQQKRLDEAESIFRRAYDRVEPLSGEERTIYWVSMNFGGLLADQGRFAEAEPLLRTAVHRWSSSRGKGSQFSLTAQIALAYALFGEGRTSELQALLGSIEAQIVRYSFDGSSLDTRLQRLKCLAAGLCAVDELELRAEASGAITPRLGGEDGAPMGAPYTGG